MGSKGNKFRAVSGVVMALGVAVGLAGCGGSSAGSPQTTTDSLARAAYVSSSATGYEVALTMHETLADKTINMTENGSFTPAAGEGEVAINMSVPASEGGALQMDAVLNRGTMYLKLPSSVAGQIPGGKPWVSISFAELGKASGLSGLGSLMKSESSLNNPGQYLDFLHAAASGSVDNLGQDTVNGHDTTHYHAELDVSKLADAVPAQARQATEQLMAELQKDLPSGQMPVDAWIDDSNLIRRLKMTYNMTIKGQPVAITMTENFLDYGPQPVPTVPDPGQTTDLLSLIKHSGG